MGKLSNIKVDVCGTYNDYQYFFITQLLYDI